MHIYEIKDTNDAPITITSAANFTCSAKDATVFGAMVIVLEATKLDIRTFQVSALSHPLLFFNIKTLFRERSDKRWVSVKLRDHQL